MAIKIKDDLDLTNNSILNADLGSLDQHSNVDLTGVSPGDTLVWDGSQFLPGPSSGAAVDLQDAYNNNNGIITTNNTDGGIKVTSSGDITASTVPSLIVADNLVGSVAVAGILATNSATVDNLVSLTNSITGTINNAILLISNNAIIDIGHYIGNENGATVSDYQLLVENKTMGILNNSMLRIDNNNSSGTADVACLSIGQLADAAQIEFTGISLDPTTPSAGHLWYNETDNEIRYYDGTYTIILGSTDGGFY